MARHGWNYRAKKGEKGEEARRRRERKRKVMEEEERTRGRRRRRKDRRAGALFLWEDPMHNLDSPCTGVKGECACGYYRYPHVGKDGAGRGNGGGSGRGGRVAYVCERDNERVREEKGRLRG